MCHITQAEVREQLVGVRSLLLSCGVQEWNPGHETGQQAPHQPFVSFSFPLSENESPW